MTINKLTDLQRDIYFSLQTNSKRAIERPPESRKLMQRRKQYNPNGTLINRISQEFLLSYSKARNELVSIHLILTGQD